MPELPEVETVVRQLNQTIRGCELNSITVWDPKLAHLRGQVRGSSYVAKVSRAAKYIVIELQSKCPTRRKESLGLVTIGKWKIPAIAVHLRMTGRLVWIARENAKSTKVTKKKVTEIEAEQIAASAYYHKQKIVASSDRSDKHLRAEIIFKEGTLRFYDPRRFGTIDLINSPKEIVPLGVDPFSSEFSVEYLLQAAKCSKQKIKVWLLRPDRVHGIGNIYASEILFDAKISPRRMAKTLTVEEWFRVRQSTLQILGRAINAGGTTFSDYRDAHDRQGGYANRLKVYERENAGCRRCRTPICRILQAGRSTFFCPTCQEKRKN